jgi:exodeoxyribonuclease VII large subunit
VLAAGSARADAAAGRLRHAAEIACARAASRVERAALRLQALGPEQVLARGYALLEDRHGRPITSVAALSIGEKISARLADGSAELTARSIAPRPAPR